MNENPTAPLVSVITVCYNAAATIAETLESVRRQTWRPLESIVVDGASTDGTQDIVARYGDITGTVVSEKDKGIYDAMNKGIALARGEILHFLNADDRFVDEKVVADAVRIFQTAPEVDLVFGDAVYCTPEGDFRRSYQRVNGRNLLYGDLCHQVVFARRRLFEHFGNFNLDYRINADYDWFLRVFHGKARIKYIHRTIAYFKLGGQSSTNLERMHAERQRIQHKYKGTVAFLFGNLIYRVSRRVRKYLGDHDPLYDSPKIPGQFR